LKATRNAASAAVGLEYDCDVVVFKAEGDFFALVRVPVVRLIKCPRPRQRPSGFAQVFNVGMAAFGIKTRYALFRGPSTLLGIDSELL
jgi:hypothetical protein